MIVWVEKSQNKDTTLEIEASVTPPSYSQGDGWYALPTSKHAHIEDFREESFLQE